MTNANTSMAAELLSVSSSAYARSATNRLLAKRPELDAQSATQWNDFFVEHIHELSAALLENEQALFNSRVRWTFSAYRARDTSLELLRDGLESLAETLQEELPKSCCQRPAEYISSAVQSLETGSDEAQPLDTSSPVSRLSMQYLLRILEGDCSEAIELVVEAHSKGLSIEETYHALIGAQNEIGRMWQGDEANIAEEHLVTSTTVRAMAALAFKTPKAPSNGRTVVAAAVAGNTHVLGVRAVADFFEFAGWRAVCLGGDLPAMDIAQAVPFFNASLVMLSAALSTHLNSVRETVAVIKNVNANCKIIVGGAALQEHSDLWRRLGADGFSNSLAEAVALGTRFTDP